MQCTYCIVPFTRGAEQSRTPEAIRREMLSLGEAGYKEVTLLGQNIDAYGRDLPGFAADGSGRRAWTFTDLLRYVHDVPGGWQGCGSCLLCRRSHRDVNVNVVLKHGHIEQCCSHGVRQRKLARLLSTRCAGAAPTLVRRHRAHPVCHLSPPLLH